MAQPTIGQKKGAQTIKNVIRRHRCQPCNEQQKKIMASSWCTECQVALCSTCHKHHDSLKLTRYHHVVSMAQFQAKLTASHVTQKLEKMQIKEFQKKKPTQKQGNFKRENILARKVSPPPEVEVLTPEDLEKETRMKEIKFTYLTSISLLKGNNAPIIKDIRVLSNGHVVMADGNNKRLLTSEIGGIKQNEIGLPGKPFCIAKAPDDTIAVSLYESGKVVMVDVFKRQIFREIVITCFGVVFTDDYLILNCGVTGLKAMDMNGDVFEAVKGVRGDGYLFIGIDNNVYCNCSGTNQILCCNIRRNLTQPFSKLSIEHPLGTTVDDEGFIYEVGVQSPSSNIINEEGCKASESVHMISSSGKHHRLVLTKKDGVNNPYAVFFDKSTKTLLVANDFGESVVIFQKDLDKPDTSSTISTTETYSEYSSRADLTPYTRMSLYSP